MRLHIRNVHYASKTSLSEVDDVDGHGGADQHAVDDDDFKAR